MRAAILSSRSKRGIRKRGMHEVATSPYFESQQDLNSGKKKAHKHKFFCPVGLGTTPGLSRGFHRVCPWDKSGENLGQTQVFSLCYTVEARFHRVCPWDKPGLTIPGTKGSTESLCEKHLCAFFARDKHGRA